MNLLIYLEGERLTLSQDVQSVLTFAIDDLRDFSTRQASFSKTIILAGDANNNRVFGHLFDVSIENPYDSTELNIGVNYNPLKSAECQVFRDGLQVFNGVLKVDRITLIDGVAEYECNLFGKLTGLSSAIGDKRLEDLDFTDLDHVYNETNIIASWSAPVGIGYHYPLIDDGRTIDGINWDVKSFKPAVHIKEYIDRIFAAAGYTYDSAFFNSNFFKKLILPSNYANLDIEVEKLFHKERLTFYTQFGDYYIPWDTDVSTPYTTGTSTQLYSRTGNVLVNISYSVDIEVNAPSSTPHTTHVLVRKNGVTIDDKSIITAVAGASGVYTLSGSVFCALAPTDSIGIFIDASLPAGYNVDVLGASFIAAGNPTVKFGIEVGDDLPMSSAIPRDVKQIELLKSLGTMFNLMFVEDADKDNFVKIIPYKDFYQLDAYLDWSDKVDESKAKTVQITSAVIGVREFLFTYKKDVDYNNETYTKKYGAIYGQRRYDTGLQFVKDVKTIDILFAPTVLTQISGTDRVHGAIYKLNNGVKEQITSVPRILVRSETALTCAAWNIKNGLAGANLASPTTYGYAGHVDDPATPTLDILFGAPQELAYSASAYPSANLFNVYWDYYIAETTDKDSKYVSLFLRLNDVDISVLDFSRIIFIAGTLYRLSKIIDYNAGGLDSTKTELIKVVNIQ